MKVVIDCRMWGKNFGGIGRYVQEIVLELLRIEKWDFTLIVADEKIREEIEIASDNLSAHLSLIICNAKMFTVSEQVELPKVIPLCDIFWSPYMNVPFLPCKAKYRVVTLHDVFHLANPQYYSFMKRVMIKPFYYFSSHKSDLILTVSNFSKNEIAKTCGANTANKTVAVYNGCDIDVKQVHEPLASFKYILFVGSVKPHKNLKNALLGFSLMKNKAYKFVIVGKKEGFITGDKEVFGIVDNLNKETERVIFTGNISDEELYSWYKGATTLVQPSFYEGFGLPVVEAMKFKLPIACSDIPVFREIGKDLISYFNPDSPDSVAECLDKVVLMPKKDYPNWISWKETANQIAVEFEKLASK